MLGQFACALYWFNPLAWLALSRLRCERERACDDLTLNTGVTPSDYAEHLLAIARMVTGRSLAGTVAVAMARRSALRNRIRDLLDSHRNRHPLTRRAAVLMIAVLAAVALPVASVSAAAAPTPLGETADGRSVYQWQPSESWPGGRQHDPRLDSPVHFWRAGLSLEEVFIEIEEQTGVHIRVWPEGDGSGRLRVNLYLNPAHQPALRALLAQLMWVTDCAFGVADPPRGADGRYYYLLGVSSAESVSEDLPATARTAYERAVEGRKREWDELGRRLMEKLDQLREALQLPRETVIARYKYIDDQLMLTLLDPRRQAAAEYVCNLFEERDDPQAYRPWDDLSEEERALVRRALPLDEPWPEGATLWVGPGRPIVGMDGWVERGLSLDAHFEGTDRGHSVGLLITWGHLSTEDAAHLGRLLGDQIPEDEESESAYRREWSDAAEQAVERVKLENLQQTFLRERSLSKEKTALLSSLSVPLEGGRDYALWQVQEAVAATSGLNVISDCFWQAQRPLVNTETALSALETSCHPRPEMLKGRRKRPFWMLAWEWGDAGSFLRFRSTERATWRASLLPPEILAQIDAWLEPKVRQALESDKPWLSFGVELPGDMRRLLDLAGPMDDVQLEYGPRMVYEDPTNEEGIWKQAMREAHISQPFDNVDYVRLFASLTPDQWERAGSEEGLKCSDLDERQLSRLQSGMARHHVLESAESLATTRLRTRGRFPTNSHDGARDPNDAQCLFTVKVDRPRGGGEGPMLGEHLSLSDVYGGYDYWHISSRVFVRRPWLLESEGKVTGRE
jgi:hypothetical protein